MDRELVDCKELVYVYNDDVMDIKTYALKGIDLKVNSGEFVAILGRNGSGKSTVSKLINALFTPTEGTVYVDGLDTKKENNIWDIRKSCGMVFQNPDNQIVATIVEEDVAFGPENLGVDPKEIRKRVDGSLKRVGMEEFKKHAPHMLSGGQKQRVAIAGILAMEPKCIIFDEATAMLDPSGRKEVMKTIKDLKDMGITIILITHYMEEAVKADRVIVMDSGKVVTEGTPKEVFSKVKKMKELGLDVPQVSELAYLLRQEGIDIKDNILSIDEMVDAICQLR